MFLQTTRIEDLIVAQIPALRRYARALVRDCSIADDLVQDALLRAVKAQHQWQLGTDMRAWLFTILYNVYRLHRRTMARRPAAAPLEDTMVEGIPSAAAQVDAVELRELERAMARLPVAQRTTLLLIALEGMSYKEAARVTGVPVGTVRSRLCRARMALLGASALRAEEPIATPSSRPERSSP